MKGKISHYIFLTVFITVFTLALPACSRTPAEEGTTEEVVVKDGWTMESGRTCYYKDGIRWTGWFYSRRSVYYFDDDGYMVTGKKRINDKYYIFQMDGRMRKGGWFRDETGRYYLYPDGHAACGKQTIEGTVYLFGEDGSLLHNEWSGNNFAGEDGVMVTDQVIDGLLVDADGNKVWEYGYGTGGCLYSPSLDFWVPAYITDGGEEGQAITDRENSAALLTSFPMPVVADHKNQGFDRIKDSVPGQTLVYMLTENTVSEYVCSHIFEGTNAEHDILDSEGNSIENSDADLCLYTCNEDWEHVTVVYYKHYH